MSRDAHAEHLDENYRYQRHVYDLTREYYLLGRKQLIAELKAGQSRSVLEIGCGTALNLIRAARLYPAAHFYGVDLSRMMLETAAGSLARKGMSGRIKLALGDATDFDAESLFGRGTFDRIFFSYSLSMIPPWEAALEHAAELLAPGGSLHIVDFGGCEGLPGPAKTGLYAWLEKFKVTPRQNLETVLKDLARRHGLTLVFTPLYRGYSYSAVLSRR